jgi:ElaB/YqjD/DUF883 family membrane-anchored ribosome-binding protein
METFFKNISAEEGTTERLIRDLSTLINDAEELVKATGGKIAEKSKEELMAGLDKLKASCRRIEKGAAAGAQNADQFIRQNPYPSVGIAFAVGLIIGMLLKRG